MALARARATRYKGLMKRSHASQGLLISALLAILLALGYTAWWFSFAFGARNGVESWSQQRRADGWQVSYDDITLRGYPFTVVVRLRNPRIAQPGRFDWQGSDVVATVSPFMPDTVYVRAAGKHQLRIPGDSIALEATKAQAVIDLDARGRMKGLSADLQGIAATSAAGDSSADSLQLHIEEMKAPTGRTIEAVPNNVAFGFAANNVMLPARLKLPVGRHIAAATLRGRMRGQWEEAEFNRALANWRDSGGVIELDEMMLRWQPLTLAANGTLALDNQLQPLIAVSAKVTGFFETIDALSAANIIRSRDASMAKLVLGVLSKQPASGGPAVLELPLTVQDGIFYAGPAAITKVPELPWKEPPPVPIPGRPAEVKREDLLKPGITVGPQGEVTRQK